MRPEEITVYEAVFGESRVQERIYNGIHQVVGAVKKCDVQKYGG